MKRAMLCTIALGVGAAAGARADGMECCRPTGAKPAACCQGDAAGGKICLDASGMTAVDLGRRLSAIIGTEVRVQGSSYETVTVKVCATTPEAALTQVAAAMHARWRPAFIFGPGGPAARTAIAGRAMAVNFQRTPASTAAYVTAARAGAALIADRPLQGHLTMVGKNVPPVVVLNAIAAATGLTWKPAFVLQTGPDTVAVRRDGKPRGISAGSILKSRPDSPLTHLHHDGISPRGVAPAPGMIIKDPEAQTARLEEEALRRQQLGEWAGVFTQESPSATKRAVRDLRIRVETAIQKLESYPPQNRHLGVAMWRARYERMLEDYKGLTPDQQKQVQPVLDAMKYFAAPGG